VDHAGDPRPWLYELDDLEAAETADPLWNAAQRQMMQTGHMHGYVRMYWAKKILEWTADPADAFDHALQLNDRYHLDGRDPSGIVGVAWAIGGVHDRAWPERPVFGKIRSMTLASTGRKFNSKAYCERWSTLPAGGRLF
jgi:deoxyribodipyrimidine photo-lyase